MIPKCLKRAAIMCTICCAVVLQAGLSHAVGTYLDFDDFPVTVGTIPGSTPNWEYSSSVTNNYGYSESASSGWKTTSKLSDGWNWFFDFNRTGKCDSHMYVDTYGFLDIVPKGHSGNALRNTITGGLAAQSTTTCGPPLGTPIYNKESFKGFEQVYKGGKVGHSYIYFKKVEVIGSSRNVTPYKEATDSNRLSAYIYLPPETDNGVGGYNKGVMQTYQVGLFRDPASTGYHHYINFLTRGGGWTKIQIEETTNGDNGGNGNTRYIPNFLNSVWQFYFTTLPYAGIAPPPYDVLIDEIEFSKDSYTAQNNETISNIAVLYKDTEKTFEISFNDKYKNADAYSTYELRYSSAPITNENWSTAKPVSILADARFYIKARTDGKFMKWWPYYQGVWAPFTLSTEDTKALTPGQIVYFAVKDVSQLNNSTAPVDGINGYWGVRKGGRPYDLQPANFDFVKDGPALPLIKRASYTIGTPRKPAPPPNLIAR